MATIERTVRDVLKCYQQAMMDFSANDLADLYAPNAIHEFPLFTPGRPVPLTSQAAVRGAYLAMWANPRVRLSRIENVALHEAHDPEVILSEWTATATVNATGETIKLAGVISLQIRDGYIVHVRDYMDVLGLSYFTGSLPALVTALERQTPSPG